MLINSGKSDLIIWLLVLGASQCSGPRQAIIIRTSVFRRPLALLSSKMNHGISVRTDRKCAFIQTRTTNRNRTRDGTTDVRRSHCAMAQNRRLQNNSTNEQQDLHLNDDHNPLAVGSNSHKGVNFGSCSVRNFSITAQPISKGLLFTSSCRTRLESQY